MFLFFGWGCLIWQPLALQYGKRPVYLISMLATLATQVWAAHTDTNGKWIASKIIQGFVGAPIESLCEISVTDVYFTHERGRYIALYGLLLAGSNFFAPIIAGFIADGQGWRWVLVRIYSLHSFDCTDYGLSTGPPSLMRSGSSSYFSLWRKPTTCGSTLVRRLTHRPYRRPQRLHWMRSHQQRTHLKTHQSPLLTTHIVKPTSTS